jgi:hypothetical protein
VTGRTRLRLADPAAAVPDTRASVARALLDRWFPIDAPRADQAVCLLDPDGRATGNYRELQNDPRYLIGRLQQALTALLQAEVPPMDATAQLLDEAIRDAIRYRRRTCPDCRDGICCQCRPHWQQAAAYEALRSELGIIGGPLPEKPRLRVAGEPPAAGLGAAVGRPAPARTGLVVVSGPPAGRHGTARHGGGS